MDLASAKKCLGVTIQHADKEEVVHLCPSVPLHLPLVVLGSLFRAESGYFPARPQKKILKSLSPRSIRKRAVIMTGDRKICRNVGIMSTKTNSGEYSMVPSARRTFWLFPFNLEQAKQN
jgi:hypothetical protein